MNYAAVDKETYYDDECSVSVLGVDAYIAHPRFDCYMVSIVTDDWEWCGHPKDAPWHKISGPDWEWVAWNASFDERIYQHLQKIGVAPADAAPNLWHCAADLSVFVGAPRALAASCAYLYGEKVSKTVRDKLKGVIYATLSPEKQEEVRQYALVDARKTLRFWQDLSPKWPDKERRLSRLTRQQGWRGLRTDMPRIERGIAHLKTICWAAENKIPWSGTDKMLSYPALVAECQKAGISAPASVAMDSEECAAWEEKYGGQFQWIDAMRTLRRANALLKKLEVMRDRTRPDGRMGYACKYFGAHTGRWSGGGGGEKQAKESGFNPQNLPQGEMFGTEWLAEEGHNFRDLFPADGQIEGVDLRKCIVPEPGHHFNAADLSQIEPRVLWVFAGDTASLTLVRDGMSPYEAHAITTMSWPAGEKIKGTPTYRLAKARVLSLGYNAGWIKFITMCRLYISEEDAQRIFSAPITPQEIEAFESYLGKCRIPTWHAMWKSADDATRTTYVNSWKIVMGFRRSNPKIASKDRNRPGLWKQLDDALKASVGDDLEIALPSGRSLVYKKIAVQDGEITGIVMKFGRPTRVKLYGGLLCENLVQATARDVFAECLLRLDDAGIWTAVHIHDEAVTECLLDVPAERVREIMSQPPSWMPTLPVASECESHAYYTK